MSDPVRDALVAPFWLATNLLLVGTAWKMARRLFPSDTLLQVVMHTIVLSSAIVVATATVVGGFGLLHGHVLLASGAGVSGILRWLLPIVLPHGPESGDREACFVPRERSERCWLAVWAILVAFWIGHVVTGGLLKFPTDFDSLMYHIPLIVQWIQAHSLYAPDCMQWSLPANNELVGLWLVAPFSGDFFISLMNLPSVLLAAAATLELGRLFGLSRTLRHLAALAVVSTNPMLRQLVCAENDITVAAMFLAASSYAIRFARVGRMADLLLGAGSLGLLAGVKYYALGYAAAGWTIAVLVTCIVRGWRCALRVAVTWMLGAVALGGFWYLRNVLITGSPLYPVGTSPTNDLQGEIYPGMWQTTYLGNGSSEMLWLTVDALQKIAGPCHLLAFLFLPISLLSLGLAALRLFRRMETRADGVIVIALCVSVLLTGFVLLITPFAVEDKPGTLNHLRWGSSPVRYGTCFLSLSLLAFVWLLDRVHLKLVGWAPPTAPESRPKDDSVGVENLEWASATPNWVGRARRFRFWRVLARHFIASLLPVLFAGLIAYQLIIRITRIHVQLLNSLLLAADVLMIVAILYLVWDGWPKWRRVVVRAGLATSLAGASIGTFHLVHWWHAGFGAHYDQLFSGSAFTRLAADFPAGMRVCVLDHRPYPFFGSARQYRVCQPAVAVSYEKLLEYLDSHGVTVVATRELEEPDPATTGRFRWSYRWLIEHPDRFDLVEQGSWFAVFRLLQSPANTPFEKLSEK